VHYFSHLLCSLVTEFFVSWIKSWKKNLALLLRNQLGERNETSKLS